MKCALLLAGCCLPLLGFAQAGQQPVPNPNRPVRIDPAYSRTANETGGQVWVMDRTKVADAMKIMQLTSSGEQDALLSANGRLGSSGRIYQAPVDKDFARLLVSVTGTKNFEVRRPSGPLVLKQENLVEYLEAANGAVYAINNPEPGPWTVSLGGGGEFTLRVNGVRAKDSNAVEFDDFRFVELGGRPGHEGMFKIQGNPLAGREAEVQARLSGAIASIHFEFRSPDGTVLKSFRLQHRPEDEEEYTGQVEVPQEPFVVYAAGVGEQGARFQRLRPQQVNPQSFRVSAPPYWELKRGQESACTIEVTNHGPAGSFQVTATSLKKLVRDITPPVFNLDTNATAKLTLTFNTNYDEKVSGESVVILVRRANSEQSNFAIIETTVMP